MRLLHFRPTIRPVGIVLAVTVIAAVAAIPPLTAGAATTPVSSGASPAATDGNDHWVATWGAMPQLAATSDLPPSPFTQGTQVLGNATLRQTIHISIGGSRFRLQLSNLFGGAPLPITAAAVALPTGDRAGVSGIQAGTSTPLTFDGQSSVTIAQGSSVRSDPLDIALAAQSNVTVTLYLATGQASTSITAHPGSRTTSYLVSGDHVGDTALSGAATADHWYFISGLDVLAPADAGALAILGDSITDGRGSTTNGNNRWPDRLLARLQQQDSTAHVAVVNEAAGGNAVLKGGIGPTAVSRFGRDILGQSSVRWVIVFEGVNDLGGSGSSSTADALITAYQGFITSAHEAGLKVYGATITPFGGNGYADAAGVHEAGRQQVNTWIRTSGQFDAVIDFDQAVRDPSHPGALAAAFDTGDHLHLNPTGYQAMADAVPTGLFTA